MTFSNLAAAAETVPGAKCTSAAVVTADERIASCTAVIDLGNTASVVVVNARLKRARAYLDRDDFDSAIADYVAVIAHYPTNMSAYSGRAFAYYKKGDFDRAVADYTKIIELNPRDERVYLDRGAAYHQKNDFDRAIADYTQAIGLSPKDERVYYNRGATYQAAGDLDRGIADYTKAIEINPKYREAYQRRAYSYKAKGDLGRAIADYDQVVGLDPQNALVYRYKGVLNFEVGALAKSLEDLNRSSAIDPKDLYTALWLDIVGKRQNIPGRLAEAKTPLDMSKWPAPVVRLFLGETTSEAMFAAADDPDAKKKKGQVCEANFFAGELALQQGSKDEAMRLFRLAGADCPKDFLEWSAATAELKAAGANP